MDENTKPETTQPGDLRSALLDIAAAANAALYASYLTPEHAAAGYAEALDDIRKIAAPGVFSTPPAVVTGAFLAKALPAPRRGRPPKKNGELRMENGKWRMENDVF